MTQSNQIKTLRLARAWSQEQLAEISSLSVRTIQRVENGEQPSLETLSALAAAFEVSVSTLSSHQAPAEEALNERIVAARQRLADEAHFYRSAITAVVVCSLLYLLNRLFLSGGIWPLWVASIWGALVLLRGVKLFVLRETIAQWRARRLQKLLRK